MKTLVIYDDTGKIFYQQTGYFETPIGLNHMIIEMPSGVYVDRVDVSSEIHKPIFIEVQKSQLEQEIESLKNLVADLTEVVLMGV